MKLYNVEITDEALSDMDEIYYYIAVQLQAPENALGQYNRIAENILLLNTMPERYPIIESEPEKARGVRFMPVDNYSVFYVINNDRVIITNVVYSASDIRTRLKNN